MSWQGLSGCWPWQCYQGFNLGITRAYCTTSTVVLVTKSLTWFNSRHQDLKLRGQVPSQVASNRTTDMSDLAVAEWLLIDVCENAHTAGRSGVLQYRPRWCRIGSFADGCGNGRRKSDAAYGNRPQSATLPQTGGSCRFCFIIQPDSRIIPLEHPKALASKLYRATIW